MNRTCGTLLAIVLVLCFSMHAQRIRFRFHTVVRDTIESRLKRYEGKRESNLRQIFEEAGCQGDHLREQAVKHVAAPNLICTLPGSSNEAIIVGAHFDKVDAGDGVVDNWSGASLLPSLYEALRAEPRRHTFIFVAFTAEENGLLGSEHYVKQMTKEDRARTLAMVNLDSLGLTPTKIWPTHSHKGLMAALAEVSQAMKLPVGVVHVEKVGTMDCQSFALKKIRSLCVHSVTQQTFPVLHSHEDRLKTINMDAYYDTFRLMAGYLAFLDQFESPTAESPVK